MSAAEPSNYQAFADAWNTMARRAGLPPVKLLSQKRRSALAARLRESSPALVLEAIAAIETSEFLCGDNDRGWKADFDFLLQAKSFPRILEGAYHHRRAYRNGALELLRREAEQRPALPEPYIDVEPIKGEQRVLEGV